MGISGVLAHRLATMKPERRLIRSRIRLGGAVQRSLAGIRRPSCRKALRGKLIIKSGFLIIVKMSYEA